MQILRFDEAGSNAPHRKKSARGMIVAGLVASLFGIGTAFASTTIGINGGGAIDVGQGVSIVTACDSDNLIDIRFGSALKSDKSIRDEVDDYKDDETATAEGKLKGKPVFYTNNIVFSKVDDRPYDRTSGFGCDGEYFDLQIYYHPGEEAAGVVKPYTCGQLGLAGRSGSDGISGTNYLNETPTVVTCDKPGTVTFKVPTYSSAFGPDIFNSTFTVPLGEKRNTKTLLTALDISYFTLVSRHS